MSESLQLMHTDICDPFDIHSWNGEKYFITFIDDFSQYCYLHLLHEKTQPMNVLKVFINKVERLLDKKVEVVRSNRSGEYYRKFDKNGQ